MAKSTKIIAALGVAGMLGMIAMPTFAADDIEIVDTINVHVVDSCTFKTNGNGSADDTTFSADVVNGGEATFKVGADEKASHTFNVFCNNFKGYTVTAEASGLTASGVSGDHSTIEFVTPAAYESAVAGKATAADGKWTAKVDTTASATGYTVADNIKKQGDSANDGIIVTKGTATEAAGSEFSVEYKAFAGQSTQAGQYTGNVTYTLAATE